MREKGKTLLVLTGLATVTLHVLNRLEYTRTLLRNSMACIQNHYYEWRFGKIRYTKTGSGSPLLLLHDLTIGSSLYEYHKLVEELAKDHEVYCMDLLGFGLSDKPDMTYTNYLYVQQTSDFIKNIIGRKTDIIASSDSVPVAVMACHNDPEMIQNIVAINPQDLYCLNQIPSKQTRILKFLLETPVLGTFLYNLHCTKAAMTSLFQEKYNNPCNMEEEDVLSYVESAHTPDYHSKYAYSSYIGRYMNTNIIHALKEINNSIYIIAGENKEKNHTIVENYEYYNNAIESVFIPHTKQLPHLEKPEETLLQIQTFLG